MSAITLDALLAYVHHLGIGALVAFLAMETALLRGDLSPKTIPRLAAVDGGIGASAMLILAAGILRVIYGAKGADYYLDYPVFWVKMALFAAAALSSAPPTIQFLRWRKAFRDDPAFAPPERKVKMVRMHIRLEWMFLALIPLAAVLMARGFWF